MIKLFKNISIVFHRGVDKNILHWILPVNDENGDLMFFPLQSALGFHKSIIYFPDVTALAGNSTFDEEALDRGYDEIVKVMPSRNIIESEGSVVVFSGAGEGLPSGVMAIVTKFAKLHSSTPCYYISGAAPVPATFETFKKFRGSATNLQLMTKNSFETSVFQKYGEFNLNLNSPRDKKFHWFLGGCRPHRYMLLALLQERKVLHHGILSYGWQGQPDTPMGVLQSIEDADQLYRENFKNIIKVCKKHLPDLPEQQNPYVNRPDTNLSNVAVNMPDADVAIYNNTFFEITTESSNATSTQVENGWMYPSTNPLFLTEKTFRPIAAGLMSVTVGQQGHFGYLESQGYHPFDSPQTLKKIDRIYDDEERMIAQADYIAEMCNWKNHVLKQHAIDYNSQLAKDNRTVIANARETIHLHAL